MANSASKKKEMNKAKRLLKDTLGKDVKKVTLPVIKPKKFPPPVDNPVLSARKQDMRPASLRKEERHKKMHEMKYPSFMVKGNLDPDDPTEKKYLVLDVGRLGTSSSDKQMLAEGKFGIDNVTILIEPKHLDNVLNPTGPVTKALFCYATDDGTLRLLSEEVARRLYGRVKMENVSTVNLIDVDGRPVQHLPGHLFVQPVVPDDNESDEEGDECNSSSSEEEEEEEDEEDDGFVVNDSSDDDDYAGDDMTESDSDEDVPPVIEEGFAESVSEVKRPARTTIGVADESDDSDQSDYEDDASLPPYAAVNGLKQILARLPNGVSKPAVIGEHERKALNTPQLSGPVLMARTGKFEQKTKMAVRRKQTLYRKAEDTKRWQEAAAAGFLPPIESFNKKAKPEEKKRKVEEEPTKKTEEPAKKPEEKKRKVEEEPAKKADVSDQPMVLDPEWFTKKPDEKKRKAEEPVKKPEEKKSKMAKKIEENRKVREPIKKPDGKKRKAEEPSDMEPIVYKDPELTNARRIKKAARYSISPPEKVTMVEDDDEDLHQWLHRLVIERESVMLEKGWFDEDGIMRYEFHVYQSALRLAALWQAYMTIKPTSRHEPQFLEPLCGYSQLGIKSVMKCAEHIFLCENVPVLRSIGVEI